MPVEMSATEASSDTVRPACLRYSRTCAPIAFSSVLMTISGAPEPVVSCAATLARVPVFLPAFVLLMLAIVQSKDCRRAPAHASSHLSLTRAASDQLSALVVLVRHGISTRAAERARQCGRIEFPCENIY